MAMQTAEQRVRTAHVVLTIKSTSQSLTSTFSGSGDISFRDQRWRVTLSVGARHAGGDIVRSTEDIVQVARRQALRDRPHSWTCGRLARFQTPLLAETAAALTHLRTRSRYGVPVSAMFDGVPVWRVRQTVTVVPAQSASGGETIDYLIAQTGATLLRETAALKLVMHAVASGRQPAHTLTLTKTGQERYSAYGKSVSIALPGACRGARRYFLLLSAF